MIQDNSLRAHLIKWHATDYILMGIPNLPTVPNFTFMLWVCICTDHDQCNPIFNFLSAKLSLCQQQSPQTSVVWSPSLGGGAVPQLLTGSSLEPLPPYSPTCNPTTSITTTYCDTSPHICYSPYRSSLLGYLPLPPPHICEVLKS